MNWSGESLYGCRFRVTWKIKVCTPDGMLGGSSSVLEMR